MARLYDRILEAIEGSEREYMSLSIPALERLAEATRDIEKEYAELDEFRAKLEDWWQRETVRRSRPTPAREQPLRVVHLTHRGNLLCGAAEVRSEGFTTDEASVTCIPCRSLIAGPQS